MLPFLYGFGVAGWFWNGWRLLPWKAELSGELPATLHFANQGSEDYTPPSATTITSSPKTLHQRYQGHGLNYQWWADSHLKAGIASLDIEEEHVAWELAGLEKASGWQPGETS